MRLLLVPCQLSTANTGMPWGTSVSIPAVFSGWLQLFSQHDCASDMKLGEATSIAGAGTLAHQGLHGPWDCGTGTG